MYMPWEPPIFYAAVMEIIFDICQKRYYTAYDF